jgi:hypothetical protein
MDKGLYRRVISDVLLWTDVHFHVRAAIEGDTDVDDEYDPTDRFDFWL